MCRDRHTWSAGLSVGNVLSENIYACPNMYCTVGECCHAVSANKSFPGLFPNDENNMLHLAIFHPIIVIFAFVVFSYVAYLYKLPSNDYQMNIFSHKIITLFSEHN